MRSIHQTLKILKRELESTKSLTNPRRSTQTGLCSLIYHCENIHVFTREERQEIVNYLYAHKPVNTRTKAGMPWFWRINFIIPRLNWLTKHINLTKQD